MDLELALVLSCDETGCLVQYLEGGEPLQTIYSAAVKDRIRIRRRQLVAVDRSSDPPQSVWRWQQAKVLEVRAAHVVVGARSICVEARVRRPDLTLPVGERVWVAGTADGPHIFDRVVNGRPEHPDRFRQEAFPLVEAEYATMNGS